MSLFPVKGSRTTCLFAAAVLSPGSDYMIFMSGCCDFVERHDKLIRNLSDVIRGEESGKDVWKLLSIAFFKGIQSKLWICWVSQHVKLVQYLKKKMN